MYNIYANETEITILFWDLKCVQHGVLKSSKDTAGILE